MCLSIFQALFHALTLDIYLCVYMSVHAYMHVCEKWACRACHEAYKDRLACSVIVRIPA